jgi:glucokinase
VVERILKLAESVTAAAGLKPTDLGGVGVGAPGVVDTRTGSVLVAVNLGWKDYPLGNALAEPLGRPVAVDNDVNVAAWGEFTSGAGRGSESMFAIWVGTGIGGGLILNKHLFHGHYLTAGELGHTFLNADAPLGRRTVENLASRTSIVNHLTQLIRTGHRSAVPDLVEGNLDKIRSKVLAKAFEQKDPLTLDVIDHAARYVGVAVANVVTLLSLPCVVVGGGVTEAIGKGWVDRVRTAFGDAVFPPELGKKVKILESELHDDAGVVGAAMLARDRLAGEA